MLLNKPAVEVKTPVAVVVVLVLLLFFSLSLFVVVVSLACCLYGPYSQLDHLVPRCHVAAPTVEEQPVDTQ